MAVIPPLRSICFRFFIGFMLLGFPLLLAMLEALAQSSDPPFWLPIILLPAIILSLVWLVGALYWTGKVGIGIARWATRQVDGQN